MTDRRSFLKRMASAAVGVGLLGIQFERIAKAITVEPYHVVIDVEGRTLAEVFEELRYITSPNQVARLEGDPMDPVTPVTITVEASMSAPGVYVEG